jgi:hypothetical protein
MPFYDCFDNNVTKSIDNYNVTSLVSRWVWMQNPTESYSKYQLFLAAVISLHLCTNSYSTIQLMI